MLVQNIVHMLEVAGTTVFLNSHLLGEVAATCDRVAFIRSGTVLNPLLLKAMVAGQQRVAIKVDAITPALAHMLDERARATDGAIIRYCPPAAAKDTLMYDLLDEAPIPEIAERTTRSGAWLYGLTSHRRSLEERFLDISGHCGRGG